MGSWLVLLVSFTGQCCCAARLCEYEGKDRYARGGKHMETAPPVLKPAKHPEPIGGNEISLGSRISTFSPRTNTQIPMDGSAGIP